MGSYSPLFSVVQECLLRQASRKVLKQKRAPTTSALLRPHERGADGANAKCRRGLHGLSPPHSFSTATRCASRDASHASMLPSQRQSSVCMAVWRASHRHRTSTQTLLMQSVRLLQHAWQTAPLRHNPQSCDCLTPVPHRPRTGSPQKCEHSTLNDSSRSL